MCEVVVGRVFLTLNFEAEDATKIDVDKCQASRLGSSCQKS